MFEYLRGFKIFQIQFIEPGFQQLKKKPSFLSGKNSIFVQTVFFFLLLQADI